MVSRVQLDALQAYCRQYDVPFTQRYDVWSDLLEPFLDTEFEVEHQESTRKRLRERGLLSDVEIDAIRAKVEDRMLRRTVLTWEWVHYGLYDVLLAVKPRLPIARRRWLAFYSEAMEICLRGEDSPIA